MPIEHRRPLGSLVSALIAPLCEETVVKCGVSTHLVKAYNVGFHTLIVTPGNRHLDRNPCYVTTGRVL